MPLDNNYIVSDLANIGNNTTIRKAAEAKFW